MANGQISNRDLYDAINDLRVEVTHKVEAVERKVDANTDWRNRVMGQATILFIFIGAGVNFVMDYFRNLIIKE